MAAMSYGEKACQVKNIINYIRRERLSSYNIQDGLRVIYSN